MSATEHLTEPQECALRLLALWHGRSFAQVRRDALTAYAEQALTDPAIAETVRNCLRYRRENGIGRPVTKLRVVR